MRAIQWSLHRCRGQEWTICATRRLFGCVVLCDIRRLIDAKPPQYEALADINARHKHKPTELKLETGYGQLTHIFLIRFPTASLYLETTGPETVILAGIRSCKLEKDAPELNGLDIHFYSRFGALDFVDIMNVQALVGRADGGLGGSWAIFDRSGDLARAEFKNNDE